MSRRGRELLTDAKVRAAKPRKTAYKLRDGGGLHLLVNPSGSRLWRLRYGHGKTESMVSLGAYPEVGLASSSASRIVRFIAFTFGLVPPRRSRPSC